MAKKEKSTDKPKKQDWYSTYTHKDAKKHAIELGMPFPDVVNADFWRLISYIETQHSLRNNKRNPELLVEFDDWMEKILLKRGREDLIHDSLRLSYVTEERIEEESKKPKEVKPKAPKREMTQDGLVKGTKKSYTFELAKKGLSLSKVIRRVLKKFPDASEKSIKIWHRKAVPTEKVEKKPKEKKPKVIREKTAEEKALQKQRNKERRQARAKARRLANEKLEIKREQDRKKKGKKKKRG